MKIKLKYGFVVLCFAVAGGITSEKEESRGTVQDFVGKLTTFFDEGSAYYANLPSYRDKNLNDAYLNAINQHFSNLPNQNLPFGGINNYPSRPPRPGPDNYPPPGPDNYPRPGPDNYPPPGPDNYPPPGPGAQGFRPPFNQPFPPPYRPPFGYPQYPPNSFIGALESISRYDDLRCVPRLLCEVAASRKTDGYKDDGPLPFISRDGFITLLTVLNFVDDSPILSFARAALLGYSAKGDIRSCLTAYPTCPRDPDQLVNYLNNHNGGFFRFFNQQLYQQPQYVPQYLRLTGSRKLSDAKNDSKIYNVNTVNYQQYSPQNFKYGFNSRILNNPINIEEIPVKVTTNHRNPKKITFIEETREYDLYANSNLIFPTREGKRFSFPERSDRPVKSTGMIFPDRTGTGNLILSADTQGNYKIVFASESDNGRRKIRFLSDNYKQMRFPEEESDRVNY